MYTKLDLLENQKMNKILKENQVKVRKFNLERAKKIKRENIINATFMIIGSSVFMIGLMFLISVIENMRF